MKNINTAPSWIRRAACRRVGAAALLGGLAAATMLGAGPAGAQSPGAPVIRLIVPFAAASYTDNVARIIAPELGQRLHRTIVVENRPGANGLIGADFVAKAKPDGLTLLVGGASVNTVNPAIYKSLPYDPVNDLIPVTRFGLLPFLLLVNPQVPAKSVPELIAYAKQNPGKLSYGTPNSTTLVGMETFKRIAGIDILSIPYKSSQQATTDLVGDQIQVLIADFATGMPMVQAGRVRLLAVTMDKRSAFLPDVPAMSETVKNFDVSAWTGLLAPAKTPPEIVHRIAAALNDSLAAPELQAKLKSIGFDIQPLGPEEFGPYVRAGIATWKKLTRDAGIEPQ